MKKFSVVLFALVLLSGCATTTYAPQNDTGTSAVFIRQRAEPTAWNVAVEVDGKKAASIGNKSYSRFSVTPGMHDVGIDWPALAGQLDLNGKIDFPAGTTSYFLITGDFTMMGMSVTGAMSYNTSVALFPLKEEQAKVLLKEIGSR